ncbi:MAG: serine hydrolase domain-containing protein [Myxococcota bacterium]|jgi:CubicO group peptidase (beta-lactamase class C family)|nr:serine hydrolase domain-containing protein [Myxococcota bacterium]
MQSPRYALLTLLLGGALLAACGATTPSASNGLESGAAPTDDAPMTQVQEEKTITTAAGASVVIPSGWWLAQRGELTALEDPERELHLWLVESSGQAMDAAIQDAWLRVVPDFARELDQQQSPPASGGWDELLVIAYKTTPDESRAIQALARRSGDTTYVVLIDSPVAAAQRRGAQMSQIISSQTPPDLKEESFVDAKALPWSPELADQLDAFIKRGVELVQAPGLAVAVVYGGQVVFERGYGVRGPDGAPVTPDTRFLIGSTSKAFTSLMIARLVDQGLFTWNTPLKELLPSFRLGDPELAEKLELHHSLCACTGLPRQDFEFLFEFDGVSTEQRLDELAKMKPTTGLGETFQYSNALVSAGGFAAAHALLPELSFTNAYDDALRQTLLEPLGLSATHRFELLPEGVDHALPYGMRIDGSYHPLPLSLEAAIGSIVPAGGLWSNVHDLAVVMQMELDEGQHQGQVFISRENLMRRREPSVKISEYSYYGLALMLRDKAGLLRVGHGGNTLGFTTLFDFFPQHDLGVIVLVNGQAANGLSSAIERELLELLFPNAERRAEQELAFLDTARQEGNAVLLPKLSTPPAEWLDPLLGEYHNDALGTLALRREGELVTADAGEWQVEVAMHEDAGVRTLMFTSPPLAGVVLQPQDDGSLLFDVGQQTYLFQKP